MSDVAIITEACIGTKDRACVEVCPVQCIYEYDAKEGVLFSEDQPDAGVVNTHQPDPEAVAIFADTILYVNVDECTACTACYEPGICPVGAIYSVDVVPDGTDAIDYNSDDPHEGNDHTFFIAHSRAVFAE